VIKEKTYLADSIARVAGSLPNTKAATTAHPGCLQGNVTFSTKQRNAMH
jgi:hypothetical protein